MKFNKENSPLFLSAFLSLITFTLVWNSGISIISVIYVFLLVIFIMWIITYLLVWFFPQLKRYISVSAITNACLIYLGVLFVSIAKYEQEIAEINIDFSIMGIGLAILAIAFGFMGRNDEKVINETSKDEYNNLPTSAGENIDNQSQKPLLSLDIVLDESRRKIDLQIGQIDGLDNKTGIVLGITGVILTLLITNLITKENILINEMLLKLAIPLFFASLILSLVSIAIKNYNVPPKLDRLYSNYLYEDAEKTKIEIIKLLVKAVNINTNIIGKRIKLWKSSYYLLGLGLIILAIWLIKAIWEL